MQAVHAFQVASFTDAWIETDRQMHVLQHAFGSHLLQMRGLKHSKVRQFEKNVLSHLLQMRGLKPGISQFHTGLGSSHLLQMRGLKLNRKDDTLSFSESHLLQMRGLKHNDPDPPAGEECRIFYRCVD